jgi:predicted O-methyltransferase YrrM
VPTTSFKISSYLSHWLDAVDEHSLHSPFFFDFYLNVVKNSIETKPVEAIELLRQKLLQDERPLPVKDLGAGAGRPTRTVADIARTSISPVESSILYRNIIKQYKAKTIIELGTSFGINTLYLSQSKEATVYSFEGSPPIGDIAKLTFEFAATRNVQLIEGNINETLPDFLSTVRKIDFALVDANHRYQPTIFYFEQLIAKVKESSVIVIDDINYSKEMQKAWQEIHRHELVYASADLYRCGVLFFDPSLNKQHVILQY